MCFVDECCWEHYDHFPLNLIHSEGGYSSQDYISTLVCVWVALNSTHSIPDPACFHQRLLHADRLAKPLNTYQQINNVFLN